MATTTEATPGTFVQMASPLYMYQIEQGMHLTGIVYALSSYLNQVVTSGRATTTLEVKLPGNAVVRELELELRADRASWTAIRAAGQVRATGSTVIVDLGLPRTVAAVGVQAGSKLRIASVKSWTGAKFDPNAVFQDQDKAGTMLAFFPSEIQTQRLQIELAVGGTDDAIASELAVQLPDLPADLEVRIDDGPAVFTHRGPVIAGEHGWSKTGEREESTTLRVSLASAFAALTGDSQDTEERTFLVTLSAQAPGVLELKETARAVDRVWRTALGPEGSLELDFESEGFIDVPLNVDSGTGTLRELRATLASSFGPERVLPPVGPALSSQADLRLNADRAAAARVPIEQADMLSELIAVRLPLTVGDQGAELRVAFAEHDPDSNGPGDLTRAPQSKPLLLPPGDGTENWVTLELAAPLPLDEDALPWMVVLVSRGEVAWSLASGESNDGSTLRCGSPAGPWERLPEYLTMQAKSTARLRLVGHAEKAHPLAPFLGEACAVGSAYAPHAKRAELSATQKGVRNFWDSEVALHAAQPVVLRVTSRLAAKATLSALEAVVSET